MKKLMFETVLCEEKGKFKLGDAELPDDAKGELDQLVAKFRAEAKTAVWVEIEGHTDSTGAAEYNHELGIERAEAVKRYLYESHSIPLHKMNVISYGETKPIAPNDTRDGRSQNCRVVVRVVS